MSESGASPTFVSALDGPAPEQEISRDLARRGLFAAPVLIAVCGVVWGRDGAVSSLIGVGIVLVNFLLSAALMAYTARISLGLMMGASLFGYLVRLGLILLVVLAVRDQSWISLPALGLTIIVTHLGLLVWELRYVSASLAFPGLKPHHAPTN
ncbi:MAG: ATP synthase subunit I [Ilumatobacteraceae bacterium]